MKQSGMRRKNPDSDTLLMLAGAGAVAYYFLNRSAAAPATVTPAAAGAIAASATAATAAAIVAANTNTQTGSAANMDAAGRPVQNYMTGGVFDNGSQLIRCPPMNGICCSLGPSPGGGTFVDKSVQPCAATS